MEDPAPSPHASDHASDHRSKGRLLELGRLFLKIGVVGFGGPAAHIALMEDEVVRRRGWMTPQHFLDLMGATNVIPGPNSTEMTMHIGYERAGWRGLMVAGSSFIFPAVAITAVFAWAYVRFGTLPEIAPFLTGIRPAVVAVIAGAVWRLGRSAISKSRHAVLGLAACAAVLLGLGEVNALFAFGIVGMLWFALIDRDEDAKPAESIFLPALPIQSAVGAVFAAVVEVATPLSLTKLFFFFLKIGAVLYGSGYVLVAYLEGGLVNHYGWLSRTELLDAIAIGQFTPGPVLSTSTFIGYVLSGVPGAIVATLGIFLPSFVFVLVLNPLVPKLRQSTWLSAFLDAVNVTSLALMAAVTVELGAAMTHWADWVVLAAAGVLVVRYKTNAAWIIIGSAILGWVLRFALP